jgi:hypothetical protein
MLAELHRTGEIVFPLSDPAGFPRDGWVMLVVHNPQSHRHCGFSNSGTGARFMDFNKLFARVMAILTKPASEWPVIAAEPAAASDLYRNYILVLAAVPAVCGFIKMSFIGMHVPLMGTMHVGVGAGLKGMIVGYALTLLGVYLMALLINALAPTFGAQKNPLQALKTVAYAYTASWVAGIGQLLPWIGVLVTLAGAGYSIYLLNLGLPHTMKCPPERSKAYTAVSIVIAILVGWTVAIIAGNVAGLGTMTHGTGGVTIEDSEDVHFDADSPLGKLEQLGKRAEEASRKLETAQQSGDSEAQNQAMREMMGAVLSGGAQVESLSPERLKPFVPETLAGMARSDYSAERNGAMGMQISTAEASYTDAGSGRSLRLEITDMGSAKGLMAFAGWAVVQQDRESDQGYEKTYKSDGRLMHEQWDSENRQGECAAVLGERFVVKVSGQANSIEELKSALGSLDLAGLEALKNEGVKAD